MVGIRKCTKAINSYFVRMHFGLAECTHVHFQTFQVNPDLINAGKAWGLGLGVLGAHFSGAMSQGRSRLPAISKLKLT